MKFVYKAGALCAAVALLGACASTYDIDGVAAMDNSGGAFAKALQKHYGERARFEEGEGDWASVKFFNTNAMNAAMNKVPALQSPDDRSLKTDQADIKSAYARLSAALGTNAPNVAPDACARAQTWFEHWMEQSAEGHQPDDIAMARKGYEDAVPACKGEMAMAMPMPGMPDPVVIYFGHDSFDITGANRALIEQAAAAAKKAKATSVVLIGHADRSGSDSYNMGLSRARAAAVGNAIMEAGIDRSMVQKRFAGETSPQVGTDDGVRERMNRRVEIVFER